MKEISCALPIFSVVIAYGYIETYTDNPHVLSEDSSTPYMSPCRARNGQRERRVRPLWRDQAGRRGMSDNFLGLLRCRAGILRSMHNQRRAVGAATRPRSRNLLSANGCQLRRSTRGKPRSLTVSPRGNDIHYRSAARRGDDV